MVKRVPLAGLGLAMAALMLLISCGPSATSTTPTKTTSPATTTATTTAPKPTTTAPAASNKPQYGGTINMVGLTNITIFGAAVSNRFAGHYGLWEQVTYFDRTISIANGGTVDYSNGATAMTPDVIGCLATKWATPNPTTWVLDIRQGVHYSKAPNNPGSDLVNGREMTADDFVASFEYLRDTPTSASALFEPNLEKNMTIEKSGPWQVTVHTPVSASTAYLWMMGGGGGQFIWPREWLAKYGTNNDWKVQVGTGPYFITDWVDASFLLETRNPNYWDKNPIGPGKGDQLPYAETLKTLIIPDISTQLAAYRTGKVDVGAPGLGGNVAREDWASLQKTNPQIKNYRIMNLPLQIGFRRDKPDLPFKDIRVRQALMMATDMKSIKDGQFGGDAEILASPSSPLFPSCYTPIDKLPADVQALYTYSPDKAKQLLKDAGFPNGFKTTLTIDSSSQASDMAQIIKNQWLKVGVDVEIQIKESVVFQTLWTNRQYDQMMMTRNAGGDNALFVRYSFGYFRGSNSYNISSVDDPVGSDPVIEKAYQDENKYINVDFAAADKVHKDANVYILGQAFLVPTPADYSNRIWQPWIKDYFGEGAGKAYLPYIWVDQALKAQMTGK